MGSNSLAVTAYRSSLSKESGILVKLLRDACIVLWIDLLFENRWLVTRILFRFRDLLFEGFLIHINESTKSKRIEGLHFPGCDHEIINGSVGDEQFPFPIKDEPTRRIDPYFLFRKFRGFCFPLIAGNLKHKKPEGEDQSEE